MNAGAGEAMVKDSETGIFVKSFYENRKLLL